MKDQPKLVIKILTEENAMQLEPEHLTTDGLEIVIVSSKEIASCKVFSGDTVTVTMEKK